MSTIMIRKKMRCNTLSIMKINIHMLQYNASVIVKYNPKDLLIALVSQDKYK